MAFQEVRSQVRDEVRSEVQNASIKTESLAQAIKPIKSAKYIKSQINPELRLLFPR